MSLADAYKEVVKFLNGGGFNYIIIGGVAASTLGEARVTADVDIDIVLKKNDVQDFLDKAKNAGFQVSVKSCLKSAQQTGVFQITFGKYHIDFIIASTDLETQVCKRRIEIPLYGIKAFFPTPEDLILLKIIPGRDKDLLDAKNIVLRHKVKLDTKYLKSWAAKLCDEAQDMRISNVLIKLLKD
jgi:predicted nucleotidyltransferase